MENPISYSDLFSPDIQQGIEGLVSDIMRVEKQLKGMLEGVKSEAQSIGEALAGVSSATKGGRDTTKADSAQVDKLYEAYTQLSKMYEENQKTLKALLEVEKTQNERLAKSKTATDEYASALDRLKAQADLAKDALAKVGTNGNSAEVKQLQAIVKGLEEQIKNLTKAQNANATSTNAATATRKSSKVELLSLADAYASLSPLVEKTGVDLNALITTEKQHQQVSKNGQIANTALAGSYNQLYAQYNLLKTALNAMSTEMRSNTAVGREWEAEALRIMNEMKAMQEATGKSTLSVGDYGKALNGLSISTQQVLREMPTLANSVQQFFIAISNNVPIFVDNFKRAQVAMGSFTKAIGATLSAIFSWQTVLLVILTILPKIAQAIHNKRKEQEEANKATEEAINYAKLMEDAEKNQTQAVINATNKLQFLTGVINDNNRAWSDRIKAAEIMKTEWKEEFKNFTTEQILAGEAKTAIDNLTQSLVIQAQARAYLNKIGELSVKLFDLEQERSKARAQQVYEETKLDNLRIKQMEVQRQAISDVEMYGQTTARTQAQIIESENAIKKQSEAVENAGAAYRRADMQMQDVENSIDALKKKINLAGLDIRDSNGNVVDSILEIPSYYNDALKAIIDGMEDGLQKELALLDYNFKVQREKRMEQEQKLKELMEKATEDEKARIKAELSNLALAMVAEEQNYLETRKRMLNAIMTAEVEEEPDYEEEARKAIQTIVTVEKRLRDAAAYEEYERGMQALANKEKNAKSEVQLKRELNEALLDSEEQYWKDYLAKLREEGVLTLEEYNKIMEQLSKGENKSRTSTHKKRGSANFRNLTEVAFALNPVTGEKDENGIPKIKDEYMDFANAINTALQTSIDYMDEWMDKRIEMAELAVEKAQEESEAAKTALDYEMQARANGYANNVELARKEYEEKKRLEMEAIAEQKRLQKIQEGINTAQQIGALVTATANIWSAYSKLPFVGHILAAAVTALMWTSFAAAKVKAAQVTKAETHGEGMAEYLNYGGSHASGHDIDFGHTKDGRKRRVEKGEVVGVIRKDKVQKYGVDRVLDIIKSLNNGTYDDHSRVITSEELINNVFGETPENRANSAFLSAKVEDMLRSAESRSMGLKTGNTGIFDAGQLEANYEMAFNGASTDLSGVERGIETLIEQNKVRVVSTPWGRIEYKGNNKRIIRNG